MNVVYNSLLIVSQYTILQHYTPSPNSKSQAFFLYVCPESSLIVLTLTKQGNISFINIYYALRIATSSFSFVVQCSSRYIRRQGVLVVQKPSFVCLYVGRTHTASEFRIVFAVYEHNEDGISIGRRERQGVT